MAKKQIGALPIRWAGKGKSGKIEVLLVTTRETGRWVTPKGWPIAGKSPWRAAEIEALEEAGALGAISSDPVGRYVYSKRLGNGRRCPCAVTMYPMWVKKLRKNWPEHKERDRRWFSPDKAADMVEDKELSRFLAQLAKKPHRNRVLKALS